MPARNKKSMEREREAEPTNLIEILEDAHWEIKCLLREMDEILDLPTAMYELYPRIRLALDVHTEGEELALYGPLRDVPELASLTRGSERAHAEMAHLIGILDEKPWRREQIHSPEWKEAFRTLHRMVLRHIEEEETVLFARLKKLFAPARLDAFGERYKRGLRGVLSGRSSEGGSHAVGA